MEFDKTKHKELLGEPIPSNNPIQSLVNQGTYILGIDNYPNDEVISLQVKRVKECLRIIIKRTKKLYTEMGGYGSKK